MNNYRTITVLFLAEVLAAIGIAWLIYQVLPTHNSQYPFALIWVIIFSIVWLLTYDLDKTFIVEPYYKVFITIIYTSLAYLLFFVIIRENYSLKFLLYTSVMWLIFAILLRQFLRRRHKPLSVACIDQIPEIISNNWKLHCQLITSNEDFKFNTFDILVFDYHHQHTAAQKKLLANMHAAGITVMPIYELIELVEEKVRIQYLDESWFRQAYRQNNIYLHIKRLVDIIGACFLILLLLPVLGFIMLASGLTMGWPIFYVQKRIGLDSQPFKMFKFRTMLTSKTLMRPKPAQEHERRVTWLGKFLRKYRLDELPQLLNVLKGEMSLIGPRPEMLYSDKKFGEHIPMYAVRYTMRPGITGWAQVKQGYTHDHHSYTEKIRFDMYYIKHCSLWLDLKIVFKTIHTILTGFGAR